MTKSKPGALPLSRRNLIAIAGLGSAAALISGGTDAAVVGKAVSLGKPRPRATSMPRAFFWGAATAGHQVEGNNTNSDAWLLENIKPSPFEERSGDATDSFNRYPEDLRLLKSFGLNTYRFSIEWSRIEPSEGQFSIAMLDHYKRMIAECHKLDIRPIVSFNHYTVPVWFAASGGMMRPDGPNIFARYCEIAAKHLADGIYAACTLNEPDAPRILSRLFGEPPKREVAEAAAKAAGSKTFQSWKTMDPEASLQPMISAHLQGYAAIKSVRSDLPTGVTLAMIDYRSVGANSVAAAMRDQIEAPWLAAAKTGDFVGVQNYWPVYFDDKGMVSAPAGLPTNRWGFEINPTSLANAVRYVHRVTGRPILVTENGLDTDDDAQRTGYIEATLKELGSVIADGVPVLGYLHWSLLDNYEWGSYDSKFGLVAVDRTTFKRTPKQSAYVLGAIARRNLL